MYGFGIAKNMDKAEGLLDEAASHGHKNADVIRAHAFPSDTPLEANALNEGLPKCWKNSIDA